MLEKRGTFAPQAKLILTLVSMVYRVGGTQAEKSSVSHLAGPALFTSVHCLDTRHRLIVSTWAVCPLSMGGQARP